MKRLTLVFAIILSYTIVCSASNLNFEDYIYPFGCRTYSSFDSKGNVSSMTQYSFESQNFDNYLVEEAYIGIGKMSAKNIYRYHIEGNAVISDFQILQNILTGTTRNQDRLTIFAFPKEDEPYNWTESYRGEKYQCTSEYVYLNASIYHNMSFWKAVKITRENTYLIGKKKHQVVETSYWISGYGRIITLVNWDGIESTSSKLDILDFFQELSLDEYNTLIQKKKDEAILKKKMEEFEEKIKPKPFEKKYAIYQQPIIDIIDSLVNTLETIGKGPMLITIASSNDVSIQDGAFSSSPIIGESIKEYLLKLLKDGAVQLDTAINPKTNNSVEIPLILKISLIPAFITEQYPLDYKKRMWYKAGSHEPFERTSSLGDMIYTSAEEFRSANKKAKKICVVVKYIDFNDNLHLKGVEKIYIRE